MQFLTNRRDHARARPLLWTHGMLPMLLTLAAVAPATDTVPLVVVEDDGTVADTPFDTQTHALDVINALLAGYEETGAALPEILSVWTAFPFDGNTVETRFIPLANDVTGIGLENAYGAGEEVFESYPPMRAMLIHNDAGALRERADLERLTTLDEGAFAEYLFLLELSHLWGPEFHLPGDPADRAIGFDFHASFFLENPAGAGIAGGNAWHDDGDGSFTVEPVDYAALTYSPLELYLMGLAGADEVPPFALLRDAVVPADAIDPFTHRTVSAASFPWQGPGALTISATREPLTIDDVVAANGERAPAFGASPTSFTLGIALVVAQGTSDEDRDALVRDFAPIAARLAPGFARATQNRGALEVLTQSPAPPPAPNGDGGDDDGDDDDGAGGGDPDEARPAGCVEAGASTWIAAVAIVLKRRRRAQGTPGHVAGQGATGSTTAPRRGIDPVRAPHPVPRVR